jgi:PII-like signaling protein
MTNVEDQEESIENIKPKPNKVIKEGLITEEEVTAILFEGRAA